MNLKSNNHRININWPWSQFNRKWLKIIVPPNLMHINNFFSDKHYHLYLKFWLANAIKEDKNVDFWKKLYNKMQENRIWVSKFKLFEKLSNSIFWGGFNYTEPIPVDNAFNILDGSHRLACLAVIWQHPIIEVVNFPSHKYDKSWFIKLFSDDEIKHIDEMKRIFFQKYDWNIFFKRLWFVWWSTIMDLWWSWEKVITHIWLENLSNFYIRNFWSQLRNVIKLTYQWDSINEFTLDNKINWISNKSNWLLWIISFWDVSWEKVNELKYSVRSSILKYLSEYNFDSILHSVDEIHPLSNKIRNDINFIVDNMNALLYI